MNLSQLILDGLILMIHQCLLILLVKINYYLKLLFFVFVLVGKNNATESFYEMGKLKRLLTFIKLMM